MHWFWRAAIAVGMGAMYEGLVVWRAAWQAMCYVRELIEEPLGGGLVASVVAICIAFGIPQAAACLGTYGLVTWRWGPKPHQAETRCRRCGYILRGISEPRCPECGEQI